MRIRKIIFAALACAVTISACGEKVEDVHLYGTITGLGSNGEAVLKPAGLAGGISDYNSIIIPLGEDGSFDVTFHIDKPGYYKMGRNHLYLTPGDEMEAHLDRSSYKSSYKGTSEAANNYLTRMYYPQNGGFLETGRNIREDFPATKKTVDSIYAVRLAELENLKGVSARFKDMERARLKADLMTSYGAYTSYNRHFFDGCQTMEEAEAKIKTFMASLSGDIDGILADITKSDDYLELPSVISELTFARGLGMDFPVSERLAEYMAVEERSEIFDNDLDPAIYEKAAAFAAGLKNRDFADAFMFRLDRQTKLMVGRPAIDLELQKPDGTTCRLSDLKGKVMYVDFWATWCGPCMGEMPYYAELSAQYPNVRFVAVSTDSDVAAWKNKIARDAHGHIDEFLSHDPAVSSGWDVTGIPRYLLIDADFNIISANAPRPSQKDEIVPLLEKFNNR